MKRLSVVVQGVFRFNRNERGTQLIELAIAVPILLSLSLVSAEAGRLFYTTATLAKATRLGARYLTTAPLNDAAARTLAYSRARNLVVYGTIAPTGSSTSIHSGLTTSNVVITPVGGVNAALPTTLKVSITGVSFQPVINLAQVFKRQGLTFAVPLTPSTTMRYLITQPLNP